LQLDYHIRFLFILCRDRRKALVAEIAVRNRLGDLMGFGTLPSVRLRRLRVPDKFAPANSIPYFIASSYSFRTFRG
jgi:hypothetical protein